jgi:hypothetical protein
MSLLATFHERFDSMTSTARAAFSRTARAVGLPVLRSMASTWIKPQHAAFILDGNAGTR